MSYKLVATERCDRSLKHCFNKTLVYSRRVGDEYRLINQTLAKSFSCEVLSNSVMVTSSTVTSVRNMVLLPADSGPPFFSSFSGAL